MIRILIIFIFSTFLLFSDCLSTYKGRLFETVTSSKKACKSLDSDSNVTYYYLDSRHYCCYLKPIQPYFGSLKTNEDLGLDFYQMNFIYSLLGFSFAYLLIRFLWGYL